MSEPLYIVRPGKPEDINFILATFLRGLYYGESYFSLIPKAIFMSNYKVVAIALLTRHQVRVACLPDDQDVILGYSIVSHDHKILHWVQVKQVFRKKGIARSLVPKEVKQVSHLTKLGVALLPKIPNSIFNPFDLTIKETKNV